MISYLSNSGDNGLIFLLPLVSVGFAPSWSKIFPSWLNFPVRKKAKALWRAAPLILFWVIWKERNRIIFEDVTLSTLRLKLSFIRSLFAMAGCIPNTDNYFVMLLLYRFHGYAYELLPFVFWVGLCFVSCLPSLLAILGLFAYSLNTFAFMKGFFSFAYEKKKLPLQHLVLMSWYMELKRCLQMHLP